MTSSSEAFSASTRCAWGSLDERAASDEIPSELPCARSARGRPGRDRPPVHGIDITIPGAAFRGNERNSYGYDSSDGFIWAGQGGNPGCLSAPIQLEDYDEILGLSADLFDIDAGSNFGVQLRRHSAIDPATGAEVGGGDPTCDIAPVFLPHGADVQIVDAAIYDNTPDRSITINLRRKRFSNATASAVIATLQSAGSSTFMQFPTVAPSEPIIDNELYAYYLETCQPSPALPLDHTLLRIYEVRLLYRR